MTFQPPETLHRHSNHASGPPYQYQSGQVRENCGWLALGVWCVYACIRMQVHVCLCVCVCMSIRFINTRLVASFQVTIFDSSQVSQGFLKASRTAATHRSAAMLGASLIDTHSRSENGGYQTCRPDLGVDDNCRAESSSAEFSGLLSRCCATSKGDQQGE